MLHNTYAGPTVGDIMSHPPISVIADSELRDARNTMRAHGIHHLLVEDRGRIVGVLSDRDVLRAISPYADGHAAQRRDDETLQRPVFSAASYNMIAVTRDTPIELAAATMLERHISCLPVTGPDEEVVGIVTTRDLLRATVSCLIGDRPAEEQPAA
ncbi:MAG: CBS domain-containing protein [Dehalococcoidia bacterium]|jgi:acetoin utilization protein AcuB|nr:CBS domain-containing protein [Dehalococcoidia bacterium]